MIRTSGARNTWREASYVVLDFEATGLDFARDEIVSYGLVPVIRGRVRLSGSRYRVVRPSIPIPAESIRVHGLTPDVVESAPRLDTLVDELVDELARGSLVAHAAGIELGFLEPLYRSVGRRAPRRAIDILDLVASLGRDGDPIRPASPKLADLAVAYGVPHTRSHHAFSDAMTTALLFLVLAARLGRGRDLSFRHLERLGRSQNAREFFVAHP